MDHHVLVDGKERQVKQRHLKLQPGKQKSTKFGADKYGSDYHVCLIDGPELGLFVTSDEPGYNCH